MCLSICVCMSTTENQHCKRWWQTLLLPPFYLCRGHREHSPGLQRLPRHHSENAPSTVRALVNWALYASNKNKNTEQERATQNSNHGGVLLKFVKPTFYIFFFGVLSIGIVVFSPSLKAFIVSAIPWSLWLPPNWIIIIIISSSSSSSSTAIQLHSNPGLAWSSLNGWIDGCVCGLPDELSVWPLPTELWPPTTFTSTHWSLQLLHWNILCEGGRGCFKHNKYWRQTREEGKHALLHQILNKNF